MNSNLFPSARVKSTAQRGSKAPDTTRYLWVADDDCQGSRTPSPAEEDVEFLASQEKFHKDNDAAIAAELNKLSLHERETILHDLHGVSDAVKENSELVKRSLYEMETYLAFQNSALAQNPAYVQDFKLRLMFLRSEQFQVPAAAE
jgi:hypothetical protein